MHSENDSQHELFKPAAMQLCMVRCERFCLRELYAVIVFMSTLGVACCRKVFTNQFWRSFPLCMIVFKQPLCFKISCECKLQGNVGCCFEYILVFYSATSVCFCCRDARLFLCQFSYLVFCAAKYLRFVRIDTQPHSNVCKFKQKGN